MTTQAPAGRRERKKLQTRDALREAARRLFAEQGYDATTVKEIAEAADVAERTFFRYFGAKEDLLLPDLVLLFQAFERATAARPADEAPLTAVREAAVTVFCDPATAMFSVLGPRTDPLDPTVAGRLMRTFIESEDRLAEVLATRIRAGRRPGAASTAIDQWASVTSRAAMAAARAAFRAVLSQQDAATITADRLAAELSRAFGILEDGCRPPAG